MEEGECLIQTSVWVGKGSVGELVTGGEAEAGWGEQCRSAWVRSRDWGGSRSIDEEEWGCGSAARGTGEGSLMRCQHPARSLAFWFRNFSILLFFLSEDVLERPSDRLCLTAPLHERQPASSVSSAISSLGKGLCHSPRVFWWPLGIENDAMWWIFNELLKKTWELAQKNALKAHYWGCKVKHTQVRKCQNKVGLWTINSGSLYTMKWSLVLWSHLFLVSRTSAMFSALDGWWPLEVNLK